ncbi:hypothetical protein DPMN_052689 [Dreissena polymorpha]|uniref:Uncharacterized protein n=1 Tax=Dreissena polymorpha TaxID=45954 RepID=A0A9D4HPK3_DREPO|nr:hypothetical protein DPMN_052689 [Dreissena polymorpha]
MFTDVIKALCSEAIAGTDGHPLAESFVITVNGNLGTDTEDPTYQATDISVVNWKEEQKKDPTISRIYHIIDNRLLLPKDQLKKESKDKQKYLRHRSKDGFFIQKVSDKRSGYVTASSTRELQRLGHERTP